MKTNLLRVLISILVLAGSMLRAQSTGTVTQVTSTTITATGGPITCTMTLANPLPAAGVHVACSLPGGGSYTSDFNLPAGNANGTASGIIISPDSVTWLGK